MKTLSRLLSYCTWTTVCMVMPVVAAAETMRCGRWLVGASSPPAEILQKCGAPTSKEVEKADVWARNADGTPGTHVVGQTVTERWIYDRGPRQFTMVFTIRDGRTVGLEARRQR